MDASSVVQEVEEILEVTIVSGRRGGGTGKLVARTVLVADTT